MTGFTLSKDSHGEGPLGLYGSRTCKETPGPGSYDPYPLLNPPQYRMRRTRSVPDRSPGFMNLVDRAAVKHRPEPFSVSRLQSEQPLVHYANATFWDWPAQRRRTVEAQRGMAVLRDPRRGSLSGGTWVRRNSTATQGSDFDADLPRAPIGLAPPGLAGRRWPGREEALQKTRGFEEHGRRPSHGSEDGLAGSWPTMPRRDNGGMLLPVDEDEA
mmetsp:Transcript_73979/g.128362  ORF Transcript_73979/g.128362 Transcript_73979/m.128362 type:complete len:214 (+) Transcript_73979:90-731(+)